MVRKSFIWLSLAVAASIACPPADAQRAGTGNRSNVPFSSVADGMLGPVIVDVPAGASRQAIDQAVATTWQRGKPNAATGAAIHRFLTRWKLIRPGTQLSFHRPVILRENGRLRLPELDRVRQTRSRLGGGEITFVYEGWSPQDAETLRAFVDLMYPIAKQVYGNPSATIKVRIVRDDLLRDSAMHLRNGIYNASTNEIRFNPTGNLVDDQYSLTHLILYAFHDDALFAYDAWEEGFSWAATYVIFKHIRPDYDLGESFKTFYLMQLYELLNQPGIGNARFWPANYDSIVQNEYAAVFPYSMFVFRSAMAGAAWAKVYVENNAFFREFNAAYYQQYTPELAGHTPTLKAIASRIVPTVEGQDFFQWYRRQHILDTSTAAGRHFWVYALPEFNNDESSAYNVLLLYHFTRDAAGNEVPQGGTARFTYYSWDFLYDYYAEEGNEAVIPGSGDSIGVGALSPGVYNVGGPQKINIQASVNGLTRMVYWPYLVRGLETAPNDLYGVTLDTEAGEVGVIVGTGVEQKVPLSQAAFGMNAGLNGWHKTTIRVTDSAGQTVTRQVNTGYDSYAAVVQGPRPAGATYTLTLPAGAHMISVPAYPKVSDAEALGVPAQRLRLAHWDPTLSTGDPGYRYRLYPATPGLAPGIGYWLILDQQTTINFEGNPLPHDQSYLIPLRAGWNQIGHPFTQPVAIESLSVAMSPSDPEQVITLQAAVQQGKLSGTFWQYTQQQGYTAATQLEPWRGYWIYAESDLLLKVPAVASPGQNPPGALLPGDPVIGDVRSRARRASTPSRQEISSPASTRSRQEDGWRLRLAARVRGQAATLTLGASRSATDAFDPLHDAQRPPEMGDYVRLSVPHSDWGRAAGDYAIDIRADGAARYTWDIVLETSLRNEEVQLSWPDLASLPRDMRITLIDLDGGKRRYLRTTGSLVINSGETGRRRLRVEATRGGAGLLAINNITVTPTRATGALDVGFSLTSDALLDAQILSPAGRVVRDVVRGRALSAGTNHILWDGRSNAGVALGSGLYLLQLTATTEEGQSVRAVRPIALVR
ncbi:MAG TPA: FlgD immunoglobulin-like domain containing protein [Armatimonadota bacterium]|nr:FlgD immunoglobulin-like domain containing protein [Armatimonadota bacterium]